MQFICITSFFIFISLHFQIGSVLVAEMTSWSLLLYKFATNFIPSVIPTVGGNLLSLPFLFFPFSTYQEKPSLDIMPLAHTKHVDLKEIA